MKGFKIEKFAPSPKKNINFNIFEIPQSRPARSTLKPSCKNLAKPKIVNVNYVTKIDIKSTQTKCTILQFIVRIPSNVSE